MFVSVPMGCTHINVLVLYIWPVIFCYINQIYSNSHPVYIFLPTDMALHITPESYVIFKFLFQNDKVPALVERRITGNCLAPVFTLLAAVTFRYIFRLHFIFRCPVFERFQPLFKLFRILSLCFDGIECRPVK